MVLCQDFFPRELAFTIFTDKDADGWQKKCWWFWYSVLFCRGISILLEIVPYDDFHLYGEPKGSLNGLIKNQYAMALTVTRSQPKWTLMRDFRACVCALHQNHQNTNWGNSFRKNCGYPSRQNNPKTLSQDPMKLFRWLVVVCIYNIKIVYHVPKNKHHPRRKFWSSTHPLSK